MESPMSDDVEYTSGKDSAALRTDDASLTQQVAVNANAAVVVNNGLELEASAVATADSDTAASTSVVAVPTLPSDGVTVDDGGTPACTTDGGHLASVSSFESSTQCSSMASSVDTVIAQPSTSPPAVTPVNAESPSSTTVGSPMSTQPGEVPHTAEVSIVDVDADASLPTDSVTLPESSPTDEQQQLQQQQQQQQEEEQGAADVPVEDFRVGITCNDVPSAIDVLNTHYRLTDVSIHRNMITWSSWNIADIVRGPHRDSFWWRGRRGIQRTAAQPDTSTPNTSSVFDDVDDEVRAKHDVEEICSRIERRELEISRMLDKMDNQLTTSDCITPETAHRQQNQPPLSDHQTPGSDDKRHGRGNVFQRLLRALRRRFTREQHPQQQLPRAPASSQSLQPMSEEQKRQRQRRQRTL